MMLLSNKDPFGRKKWNDFLNQVDFLEKNSLTVEDVRKVINKKIEQEERFRAKQTSYSLPCPECQALMTLRPINIDPSTQTGDDSQTVWLCPNLKCMHTKYSEKTLEQWQDELKRRI